MLQILSTNSGTAQSNPAQRKLVVGSDPFYKQRYRSISNPTSLGGVQDLAVEHTY